MRTSLVTLVWSRWNGYIHITIATVTYVTVHLLSTYIAISISISHYSEVLSTRCRNYILDVGLCAFLFTSDNLNNSVTSCVIVYSITVSTEVTGAESPHMTIGVQYDLMVCTVRRHYLRKVPLLQCCRRGWICNVVELALICCVILVPESEVIWLGGNVTNFDYSEVNVHTRCLARDSVRSSCG